MRDPREEPKQTLAPARDFTEHAGVDGYSKSDESDEAEAVITFASGQYVVDERNPWMV